LTSRRVTWRFTTNSRANGRAEHAQTQPKLPKNLFLATMAARLNGDLLVKVIDERDVAGHIAGL
jgi:hypothetical protein